MPEYKLCNVYSDARLKCGTATFEHKRKNKVLFNPPKSRYLLKLYIFNKVPFYYTSENVVLKEVTNIHIQIILSLNNNVNVVKDCLVAI